MKTNISRWPKGFDYDLWRGPAPALILFFAALSCSAIEISWNSADGGSWSDTSKWSPAQVPSTNDIAVITNAGTYTVALNIHPVISGLEHGGSSGTQTLKTSNNTLTQNGDAEVGTNGVVLLRGGALAGSGHYDVGGPLNRIRRWTLFRMEATSWSPGRRNSQAMTCTSKPTCWNPVGRSFPALPTDGATFRRSRCKNSTACKNYNPWRIGPFATRIIINACK